MRGLLAPEHMLQFILRRLATLHLSGLLSWTLKLLVRTAACLPWSLVLLWLLLLWRGMQGLLWVLLRPRLLGLLLLALREGHLLRLELLQRCLLLCGWRAGLRPAMPGCCCWWLSGLLAC